MKEAPPEWLIKHPVAEAFEFSTNLKDWKYRGDYWEDPENLFCTHGNPEIETSIVKMYKVYMHSIGKCETCGRVLWVKIVPRH